MVTISLCVLVRDKPSHLSAMLKHHESLVDEIIIADVSNTKEVQDIAKEQNVKIIQVPWEEDYSKAKNKAVEQASKEWILFLEEHEEITAEDLAKLKEHADAGKAVGIAVQRTTDVAQQGVDASSVRLFKNKENISFRYKVNEVVEPSILEQQKQIMITRIPLQAKALSEEQQKQRDAEEKALLEKEIEEYADDPKPWFQLGVWHYRHEDYAKAVSYFEKATSLKSSPKLWDMLGHAYYKLEKEEEAFDAYRHAILLSKEPAVAFRNLAFFFVKEDKSKLALRAFGESLKHDARDIPTLNNVAFLFLKYGQTEKAEQIFNQIETICAEEQKELPLQTITNWGMLYVSQQKFDKAEEIFKKGLSSRDPAPYSNLIEVYRKTGREEEAKKLLAEAEEKKISSDRLKKLKGELS